ncbi:MAG: hypothetical protein G3M70_16995 [Candidatus Nitronauta litoralis]|uniref:Uncharacterized protein n=1 Tax=Candidatus Nitronauta litoralis TaxID=2705533 RepID=A0A7T0BYW0_9BACT|nr:MAG: hypothetical protein G3M70_16995 [Candidatus Nitronauta litoralis]
MSGLKSAWELSLEKSNELVPEMKKKKKLSDAEKKEIAEIRTEYKAQIADRDVTMQHKLKHLEDRVRPEELAEAAEKIQQGFIEEKEKLEKEMEEKINAIHQR